MADGYGFRRDIPLTGETGGTGPDGKPIISGVSPQRPIKILSLRVPKFPSPSAIAPLPLLTSQGGATAGAQGLDSMVAALVEAFKPGGTSRMPYGVPTVPPPVPEYAPPPQVAEPPAGVVTPPAFHVPSPPTAPRPPISVEPGPAPAPPPPPPVSALAPPSLAPAPPSAPQSLFTPESV